jgi:riboflavin-specific deaminase-like protein
MAGARTIDLMPVNLGPGPARFRRQRISNGLAEYNLRVVVSGAASLNPNAEIFRHRFSPIIVLVTGKAPERKVRALRCVADEVGIFGEDGLDFRRALEWLRQKWGVRRLLCEGGGEINAGLFAAGVVNEVYQTVCPIVFGGRNAPTLADGAGVKEVAQGTRLRLLSLQRFKDELYLVYRVQKKQRSFTNAPRASMMTGAGGETYMPQASEPAEDNQKHMAVKSKKSPSKANAKKKSAAKKGGSKKR